MEIIKEFGIDPFLLGAQIVNFLIILYILKRFFYKKILGVLHERQSVIKEGLRHAEESRLLLTKAENAEKEMLRNAQKQSKKMLEETKEQVIEILQDGEEKAKNQAQKILEETKKQLAIETKEAQKALSLHISDLAIVLLQKSAGRIFSKEDQEKIIKNALLKIKNRID